MKIFLFLTFLLASFSLSAGRYALITGTWHSPDGCIFFLTKIFDTGPDGVRGGGDDFQYASGIISTGDCDDNLNPDPSNFTPTTSYSANLVSEGSSDGCEEFEVDIVQSGSVVTSGIITKCSSGKRLLNTSPEPQMVKRVYFNYDITVYPSLANDNITIANYYKLIEFEIYSIDNRLVDRITTKQVQEEVEIDISQLERGMYLLKSKQPDKEFTGKFIKQ